MNPYIDKPSTDFARVRDGRASMPLYLDVDLTTARSIAAGNALALNIAANSLYIDADTTNTGNGIVHFQDIALGNTSAPMFVSPGFIANVSFTQLLIENAAQPGKRLRIFYGVDIDFQAGVNASIGISGNVSVIEPAMTASFASIANLAANTPQTAVAPGANTNGLILNLATIISFSGAPSFATLIAKTSAPSSVTDGDVLLIVQPSASTYYGTPSQINSKIRIPAGRGLYFISSAAESNGSRCCSYTILP